MGDEASCRVRVGGKAAEVKALLETAELVLRGGVRRKIPLSALTEVTADEGVLRLVWPDGEVELELGAQAERWAKKIRSPKGRIDKLGVKAGQRVSVVGLEEEDFIAELKARTEDVADGPRKGSAHLFFGADTRAALKRLGTLKAYLAPDGALWVIRPKGMKEITEADVRSAGKAAGLVDTKVVAFSKTHTAEKFVIPVSRR